MSYILDALRRAESERDRDRGVPGLHTQPVPVGSLLGLPSRRHRAAVWVVIGLALGLAVPLGWRWMTADDTDAADARVAASGSVTPAAPMVATPPPTSVPPVQVAQAAPPAPQPAPTAQPALQDGGRVVRPPLDLPPTPAATAPKPQAVPPQPAVRPRGPGASSVASPRAGGRPQPASAAIATPLLKLSDLPEDLRRQVPTLAFGGSVYSALAAQRMVIFNGQVLREGDLVADGLTVEEIRAKSAVLRLRGQRFEVVF